MSAVMRFVDDVVDGLIHDKPTGLDFMQMVVSDVNQGMLNAGLDDFIETTTYYLTVKTSTIDDEEKLKLHIESLMVKETLANQTPWCSIKTHYVKQKGITETQHEEHHSGSLQSRYAGTKMRDRSVQYLDD